MDAKVSSDLIVDGVAIWITQKRSNGTGRFVMRAGEDGLPLQWEEVQPATETRPTLRLTDDAARALLDALTRHYQGATDLHTVRADLLHERGRVDKLIGILGERVMR